jgi:plasmid stabilization system protein ParE
MTRHLALSDDAKNYVAEAAVWYAQQRVGLEDDFLQEIAVTLARIEANPEAFSYIHGNLRHAIARRFPYIVIYEVTSVEISVIAVMHGSRNPKSWKDRL